MANATTKGLPHPHTSPQNAPLFSLPQELRNEIFRLVLTTDTGDIHLFEEKGKLRPGLSLTRVMPRGGREEAFRSGNNEFLPKPFNAIQYTCRQFFEQTRGLEFRFNRLVCNGWTFDTFRSTEEQDTFKKDWFINVRSVTLLGNLPVSHKPDENVLHGYFKFAAAHKDVSICVYVPCWKILTNLTAFLTLGYRIREAVRGVTTPCYVKGHKDSVKNWRGDKQLAFMDQKNVRFFPSVAWSGGHDVRRVKRYTQGKLKFRDELIKDHGNVGNLVALVKMWHVQGI